VTPRKLRDTVLRVAGESPYDVVVGHDLSERLPQMLGVGVQRVAVVFSDVLAELVRPVLDSLAAAYDVMVLPIPDGERAKKAAVAVSCWEALGDAGFTRSDAIVTFGGGATTDLGGFVAATWLRGVKVVHVPTTLLGMVDAAVGGKTGINTRTGKNLVGAFHEPAGVLCDLTLLRSLPRAELVAGLGEVVKCGFIADPAILDLVDGHEAGSITADSPVLRELVERAVRVKVDVVSADLRETGGTGSHPGREVLNYGHTMAHAIERTENYRIRHGEAVSIGCVYVAELAARAGTLAPEIVDRHHETFARVGLPTTYAKASFDDLHRAMKVDKKARGSQLRFVVLADLAVPTVLAGPSVADLRDAYAAIGGTR
jgi:3-dehydroquinate synthase